MSYLAAALMLIAMSVWTASTLAQYRSQPMKLYVVTHNAW